MMRVLSRLPDRLGGADFWRPAVRLGRAGLRCKIC